GFSDYEKTTETPFNLILQVKP
ncbi:hypothetical protein MNBD_GAMMA03-805, partial [hydrothermal vent metagenome]